MAVVERKRLMLRRKLACGLVKVVGAALLMMVLSICVVQSPAPASANPVEGAIAWARGFLGQEVYDLRCQAFVHDAYLKGAGIDIGGPPAPEFHAIDFYRLHPSLQHPGDTNPPRGALVYWYDAPPDGHVGISLGNGQVLSTDERGDPTVHIFNLVDRNKAGKAYAGWMSPPGVNLSNSASVAMSDYLGHIVQWNGDSKQQKTAWLVVLDNGVVRRRWVPDISTYWCLVQDRGAKGPDVLSSTALDAMPDEYNTWASCDKSQANGGNGGDGAVGVTEQAGHNGAHTFASYHNAAGAGPSVAAGQYVSVACKVQDGSVTSSNPDGYWYQLLGYPWDGQYWAPANVFMNGDPWARPLQPQHGPTGSRLW